MAAGKGRPMASANNRPKVRAYPCLAISKNKSINVLDRGNRETVQV
jgi:hypothetical protein